MSNRIVVLTTRDLIRGVVKDWEGTHSKTPTDPRASRVLDQLRALDLEIAAPEDVEAIIRSEYPAAAGWVRKSCSLCGDAVETWVRLGDEPDYDAKWVEACGKCLREALRLFEAAP